MLRSHMLTIIAISVPLVFFYLVLMCFLPLNPGEDEICGKGVEGQMKPVYLLNNLDLMSNPSQVGYGNLMVGGAVILRD